MHRLIEFRFAVSLALSAVAGVAGLEPAGGYGLLRSVAVDPAALTNARVIASRSA